MSSISIGKTLFELRDSIHLTHLEPKDWVEHNLLGDLYDGVSGLLDRIMELHISYGGKADVKAIMVYRVTVDRLKESRETINAYLKTVEQEDYKTALIDLVELLTKYIYLLSL